MHVAAEPPQRRGRGKLQVAVDEADRERAGAPGVRLVERGCDEHRHDIHEDQDAEEQQDVVARGQASGLHRRRVAHVSSKQSVARPQPRASSPFRGRLFTRTASGTV